MKRNMNLYVLLYNIFTKNWDETKNECFFKYMNIKFV